MFKQSIISDLFLVSRNTPRGLFTIFGVFGLVWCKFFSEGVPSLPKTVDWEDLESKPVDNCHLGILSSHTAPGL